VLTSESREWLLSVGGIPITQSEIAELLEDDQVIGVVRGRSEHGPRALGHRSLLSYPSAGMKERMNALKAREWYRPVAPMVAEEEADSMFERDALNQPLHSPFMSFAPFLKPNAAVALPAVTHADSSARPQTVCVCVHFFNHDLFFFCVEKIVFFVPTNIY
jgi:predicted NodU family carbamoyl transferase